MTLRVTVSASRPPLLNTYLGLFIFRKIKAGKKKAWLLGGEHETAETSPVERDMGPAAKMKGDYLCR
jgi:hypothetical protein